MVRRSRRPALQGWAGRHHHNEQSENADQAEWQAVLYGQAHVSAGTVDEEMSEAADQDALSPGQASDQLQDKEVVREAVQGPVAEIITERARLLGAAYPFTVVGNSLGYLPGARPLYELLLGITQAPSLTTGGCAQLPRVFEHLSTLAGKGYLGPASGGLRTGWPRPSTTARFQQLVGQIKTAATCGPGDAEWSWSPESGLPEDPAPALVKEEGLDLVVWQAWGDTRGAPLYLFGQCACGSNWMDKGSDIQMKTLARWFRMPSVDPVKSLFVPRYVVPSLMREMSQRAGLVFDRVRIVNALQAQHLAVELDALAGEMASALAAAKALVPAVAEVPPQVARRISSKRLAMRPPPP